MNAKPLLQAAVLALLATGCTKSDSIRESTEPVSTTPTNHQTTATNARSSGKSYKAVKYMAEYITDVRSNKIGQTVYFKNTGNKQTGVRFVPGDPRRGGRNNITYTIDNEITTDNGLTAASVSAAIDRAMQTWETATCSDLNITKIPFAGNLGSVSAQVGYGGTSAMVADVQHSGFLPGGFFDLLAPEGSKFIIAVTFSFVMADENNNPTDINKDGYLDFAFAEIYYNDAFTWATNSVSGIDVETIALHESGHALGQAHFGKAFGTNANKKLHFAPRAVMNAAYSGEQRSLSGTDKAGHCSLWARWPNR